MSCTYHTAPTEACIALSIVFVAREAIGRRDHRSRQGATLVFAFGLLHGLGFANALAASGIQRAEFFFGLVTFNLGVEIGQLMFVGVVVSITRIGRVLESRSRRLVCAGHGLRGGSPGCFLERFRRTLCDLESMRISRGPALNLDLHAAMIRRAYLTPLLVDPAATATAPISTTSRAVVSRIVNARRCSVGRP